jgi:hypothetical protein
VEVGVMLLNWNRWRREVAAIMAASA